MTSYHSLLRAGYGVLILLAGVAPSIRAQDVPGLAQEQRVRVTTTDSRTIIGTVVRLADDTLTFETTAGELQRIPWNAVRAIEASRGKVGRIGRYAGGGAVVGVTVGVGAVVSCKDSDGFILSCRSMAPALIGGSILLGALVGAVIGARGPERWEQLAVRPGLGAVPTPGGVRTYFVMSRPLRVTAMF